MNTFKVNLLAFGVGCLSAIAAPSQAQAVSWTKQATDDNTLKLVGTCSGTEVTVFLYAAASEAPRYTAGAPCQEGSFTFQDDLSAWNIAELEYTIRVGDGQHQPDYSKREKVKVEKNKPQLKSASAPLVDSAQPADTNQAFLQAFSDFSQYVHQLSLALQTMRDALQYTTYPAAVKTGINHLLENLALSLAAVTNTTTHLQQQLDQPDQARGEAMLPPPTSSPEPMTPAPDAAAGATPSAIPDATESGKVVE